MNPRRRLSLALGVGFAVLCAGLVGLSFDRAPWLQIAGGVLTFVGGGILVLTLIADVGGWR